MASIKKEVGREERGEDGVNMSVAVEPRATR